MSEDKKILMQGRGIRQWFPLKHWFFEEQKFVKAVDGVDIEIYEGETLGIAGESGCGKSTLLRTLLRLLEPTDGTVTFMGKDISHLGHSELKPLRREMQIVFQDPLSALDGRMKIGQTLEEPLLVAKMYKNKKQRMERVEELLKLVGLDPSYIDRYPHEFSGGQRQRIVIARALATHPRLVFCDEAVAALDVSVRAQVLNLFATLQQDLGLTYLFVSHDLSVLEHICDRLAIMYLGKIVEIGTREDIFNNCRHPYTQALLSAIPLVGKKNTDRIILQGDIPSPVDPPSGCRFHTRCPYATQRCLAEDPEMKCLGGEHKAACHLINEQETI